MHKRPTYAELLNALRAVTFESAASGNYNSIHVRKAQRLIEAAAND